PQQRLAVIGTLDRRFERFVGGRGKLPLHVALLLLGFLDVPGLLLRAEDDAEALQTREAVAIRGRDRHGLRRKHIVFARIPGREMKLEVHFRERFAAVLFAARRLAQLEEMSLLALG